jgi:hypothetical protein
MIRRQSFEKLFGIIKPDLVARYPAVGLAVNPDKIFSNLHSIGFIGVLNGGSTAYYYQTSGERRVEPNDSAFVIHPCFKQALQSTSASRLRHSHPLTRTSLRERFIAQERPHLSFDPYEGSHASRSMSYIERGLEELRVVTLKHNPDANIPRPNRSLI